MALRSLDNALPTTPERPKKVAKITTAVAAPIQKSSDFVVNDENMIPPTVLAAEPVIDYISSEDLQPIPDPELKFQSLMDGLESKDWTKVCESLNTARRFALFHSTLLIPTLDKIMLIMVKSMKNPRSALCKTAIMTASDVFKSFGHNLIESSSTDLFDQLLLQLLLKASQDKRFVCEEAEKALLVMVGSMPPLQLLNKLTAYVSHTSPKVRAKSAVSFSHCISSMELEGMKEFGLIQLVKIVAVLLNDRLPEARESARKTVHSIYEAFKGDEEVKNSELSPKVSWENFCSSNLSPIQAQALIKIITS